MSSIANKTFCLRLLSINNNNNRTLFLTESEIREYVLLKKLGQFVSCTIAKCNRKNSAKCRVYFVVTAGCETADGWGQQMHTINGKKVIMTLYPAVSRPTDLYFATCFSRFLLRLQTILLRVTSLLLTMKP